MLGVVVWVVGGWEWWFGWLEVEDAGISCLGFGRLEVRTLGLVVWGLGGGSSVIPK